jgi:hypothetical protein
MRRRVRGLSASRKPVCLKSAASPWRRAIAVTGSMKDGVTDRRLLVMNEASGALTGARRGAWLHAESARLFVERVDQREFW